MGASLDLSQLRLEHSPAQRRFAQRNPAGQKGRDYTSNRNVPFSKRTYVNCARFNSNYSYVFEVYPHFLHFCARHFNFVLLPQSPCRHGICASSVTSSFKAWKTYVFIQKSGFICTPSKKTTPFGNKARK